MRIFNAKRSQQRFQRLLKRTLRNKNSVLAYSRKLKYVSERITEDVATLLDELETIRFVRNPDLVELRQMVSSDESENDQPEVIIRDDHLRESRDDQNPRSRDLQNSRDHSDIILISDGDVQPEYPDLPGPSSNFSLSEILPTPYRTSPTSVILEKNMNQMATLIATGSSSPEHQSEYFYVRDTDDTANVTDGTDEV